MAAKKRIGEMLVEGGWISRQDLESALKERAPGRGRLGKFLVEKNLISERTLLETISKQAGVEVVDLTEEAEDAEAISLLAYSVAKQYRALPLRKADRILQVAMADPQNQDAVQALQFATGMRVKAFLCSEREIDIAIENRYGMEEAMERIVRNVTEEANLEGLDPALVEEPGGASPSGESGGVRLEGPRTPTPPIVRFVSLIVLEAVRKEASDIHFEPTRQCLQVRFRQDGVLRKRMAIPRSLQQSVTSRIKVMARMDIANRRTPQDGGIRIEADGRRLDLRVSSLPGFFGEKIVLRILDQSERRVSLQALGMVEKDLHRLASCCRQSQGMILVTGPTGSGKSTTLRCLLKERVSEGINIVTLEDPMEYEMEGINQVQIHSESGLSFAGTLRAILRQDPDVIMVGEIRDSETAEVAFRAALTGHLVLSTLHTNDTVSTITRLVDMGVPRFLIGSALVAVLSQRLVRKICTSCREEEVVDPAESAEVAARLGGPASFLRGRGCSHCDYTGYKGRVGIFELLVIDPELKEAVSRGASEAELQRLAIAAGMRPLWRDGLEKVSAGIVGLRELRAAAQWQDGQVEAGRPASASAGAGPSVRDAGSGRDGSSSANRGPGRGTFGAGNLAASRARPCPVESTEEAPSASEKKRIVVAEDDPAVREAVCLTLEALSCEVHATADGEEAWEFIERQLPDLIISDIQMPRLDGYGLLRKVRTDLRTTFVPVILLTAKNRCEDRLKGYLLGGDDYIGKPFDHRELLVRARRCLERGMVHRRGNP